MTSWNLLSLQLEVGVGDETTRFAVIIRYSWLRSGPLFRNFFDNGHCWQVILTLLICNFPAIFVKLVGSAVIKKHFHRSFQVGETIAVDFADLVVGYTLPHNELVQFLGSWIFLDLQNFA